jgi:PERQ amino acid-rich with GYF domain-containing protein
VLTTPSATTPSAGAYVPPHLNSGFQPGSARGSGGNDYRYSKKELLNFFTLQEIPDVTPYFLAEWNPLQETPTANGSWSKRHDFKDYNSGPEVCWDHSGQTQPLGLMDLTEEEKTVSNPV